jgi:broad specificity phosphatase PhoE
MSEIFFIRHAETDMAGTFCGRSDPELNGRGRAQLAEFVDRLRTENIRAVYTSDLRRAHATGLAVAKTFAVDCHVRPALREIDFGRWEGLSWREIEGQDMTYARRWLAKYPRLPAPGGESFYDFELRVLDEMKFLSRIAETKNHEIAVITHAGVIRTVLCALAGCSEKSAWEQTRSYCSIVRHSISPSSFMKPAEVQS